MTGVHAAGTPGHEDPTEADDRPDGATAADRRRARVWRFGTPAVVLLSGALFATSAVDSHGTDLRPGRYSDLASVVQAEKRDYESLEQRRQLLDQQVDALTKGVNGTGVHRARGQIARLEDPAGRTPESGPGVSITLSDAPTAVLDAAVDAGATDLNRLNVHQQDIQAVVNALWSGGARAVTIAGQRVISTTGIKCAGPTVQIQGVPYPQPFVIQAVGDPDKLMAAIDADPLVSGFRADAENPSIDVGWSMQPETSITAPAYDGLIDLHYAKPLPRQ